MLQKTYAGITVDVNEEGYLSDYKQWTKAVGEAIAQEVGVEMGEFQWKVVDHLRAEYESTQTTPSIRRLNTSGIAPTKEFYQAFPGGPLKKATLIAGVPKPASCV